MSRGHEDAVTTSEVDYELVISESTGKRPHVTREHDASRTYSFYVIRRPSEELAEKGPKRKQAARGRR